MGDNGITPRLLSVQEAATYLGRTVSAIRNLQHRGKLPYVQIDGRVQFDRGDLDTLIERSKKAFTY